MFSEGTWFNPGGAAFDPEVIGNSVWLDGSADFLKKSFSGSASATEGVYSVWVQRTGFGTDDGIFGTYGTIDSATKELMFAFRTSNKLQIYWFQGGGPGTVLNYITTRVFRDIGWYHILFSYKTDESAAADRAKLFINGIEETAYDTKTNPSSSYAPPRPFASVPFGIGVTGETGAINSDFLDGYVAQATFLDGHSIQGGDVAVTDFLDLFSYGANGSQFAPRENAKVASLASSANANSFCLDFSSSSDLGNDISSKNNDFAPQSMAAANQSTNTPSLTYLQLNPINKFGTANLSEGNTRVSVGDSDSIRGTKYITSGKHYLEVTVNTVNNTYIGVANNSKNPLGFAKEGAACLQKGGDIYVNNTALVGGTFAKAFTDGDVVGVLIDVDARKFWQSLNGTFNSCDRTPAITLSAEQVLAGTGGFDLTSVPGDSGVYTLHIGNSTGTSADVSVNGGHKDFSHTPPTGYLDWGSDNYTAPEFQGADYFDAAIYEGTGSEQTIGSGDDSSKFTALAWIKNRDAADDNIWMDRVIGTGGYLSTTQNDSGTIATAHGNGGSDILTSEAQAVRAFGKRSVTIGTMNEVNTNNESYVLWQWLIGDSATSAGSITAGSPSLSTTGLVAEPGHFSIVQYTGNATDNATFAHGLGATPDLVMIKRRSGTATNSDWVLHVVGLGTENYIYPHYRIALATGAGQNGMVPGTDLVEISTGVATNKTSETHMAYCFKNTPGVFKAGVYTGNSSADGAYVSTGFKPKFVWIFNTTLTSADAKRPIIDTARYKFNGSTSAGGTNGGVVFSTERAAEEAMNTSLGVNPAIDILADGFKLRANDSTINTGTTYLYLCMADIGGGGTLPPILGR